MRGGYLRFQAIALAEPVNNLKILLASAPWDDEPDDDDFDGGLTEALADVKAGRTISHEELLRRLGIDE